MLSQDPDTGAFLARIESRRMPAATGDGESRASILEVIHRLKESILDKDRIISQKTAELVAARDYQRSILAALADAVFVVDVAGLIEFANRAAQELLDEPRLEGRPAAGLWADPAHAALFEGPGLAEVLRFGGFQRTDMVIRDRHGKRIPVSWSASVLKEEGEAQALVGIARDVRIERRMEEEKLRAIQALASSVAHEIRNPLGAIQNSVALLRRDLELSGDDRVLFDIVFDETVRINQIVTQFLSFARPVQPEFTCDDLDGVLQEVHLLAQQDERVLGGKALLFHASGDLPPLTFDAAQIKQVLWNLLTNALDAARERVAVRARGVPGGVEVMVVDDGPGMAPEVLAIAFDPFRTTKATGSGLGLAISKKIVEAHGGTLRLESTPGAGAKASFTLPSSPGD